MERKRGKDEFTGFDGFDGFDGFAEAEDDAPYESRKVWELSAFEREQVIQVYGNQPDSERSVHCPRPVQEVRTLNAWERAVFEGQSLVSPQYCVQILYKIRGEIERSELQQAVQQLLAENEELRVRFLPLGWGEKMHKLIFQKMTIDIRYRNMENIADDSIDRFLKKLMEDEKEKGFDLAKDPLLRFTLIKTPRRTSAVLVTQPRLIAGQWNAHKVFADALNLVMVGRKKPDVWPEPPKKIPSAVSSYWDTLLKNLPAAPDLPGYMGSLRRYKRKSCRLGLSSGLMKTLSEASNGNRNLMAAVLQTAWGLFQQQVNFRKDTYYCLIMPDPVSHLENATFTAQLLHPMPVRLTCEEHMPLKDIVGRQFRQMSASKSFYCSRMKDLLSPMKEIGELFPFYLNFQNFPMDQQDYSESPSASDGQVVAVSAWDAEKSDLVIYFSMENGQVVITFVGNAYCFDANGIELLAHNYEMSIRNLLELWEEKLYVFSRKTQQALNGEKANKMERHIRIRENANMFSTISDLHSVPRACVKKLSAVAELKIFFTGEEIPEQDQKRNLLFLIRGKLEHGLELGGAEPLTAVTDRAAWINESILLTGQTHTERLKVISEQAQVLTVPLSTVQGDKELLPQMLRYALQSVWRYRQMAMYYHS